MVDGLQGATGASLGKMNLSRVESAKVYSEVKNRKTGKTLRFELTESLIKANLDLPSAKLTAAGLRAAKLKDAEVFVVR